MDFSRIDTPIGIISLAFLSAAFVMSSVASPLGSLSLPSITMLTSLIYFYLMPAVAFASGDEGFFGMYADDLVWGYTGVLLYALGAMAALAARWRVLNANPAFSHPWDRQFNKRVYLAFWALAITGVFTQWALGKLNIAGESAYHFAEEDVSKLAFLTQAYNLLLPLTLILLIRARFSGRSLMVAAIVLLVFLQTGFRFRILVLAASATAAYALQRGYKVGMIKGLAGASVAVPLLVLLGAIRRYGQGVDLSALHDQADVAAMSGSFGGELSLVYTLDYVTAHPLPPLSPFDPWIVAIARLVPSFLWQDKPYPTYLQAITAGATVPDADKAGIAAPQLVEILLQWGWWGLIPLAFLYFSIATWLIKRFAYTGYEARLAGCALIPGFFGYYMQTRGYFFQIFADGLFILGPLFFINGGKRLEANRQRGGGMP